jgi:hypothetical protein
MGVDKSVQSFIDNANSAQELKDILRNSVVWPKLPASQKEALDQIASTLSIIVHGGADYDEHWKKVASYALLIADTLAYKVNASAAPLPPKIKV